MSKKLFRPNSEWVRYRDKTWIQSRKRIYLYWFKYLKHAEENPDYKVQWNKYKPWGGKQVIMNSKFDDWWEKYWKDCFGIDEKTGRSKFMITKRHKADGVRYSLLCYENRHRGSTWDIAIYIQNLETKRRHAVPTFMNAIEGLETKTYLTTGKKRERVFDEESSTNYKYVTQEVADEYDYEKWLNARDKKVVQKNVSRYLKQSKTHLENVSIGKF